MIDVVEPESFEFLVDYETRSEPVLGFKVNGRAGDSVVIPMPFDVVETVAAMLQAHADLLRAA